MRVLMICPELPRDDNPGGMAPAVRQFESLTKLGVEVDIIDMHGPKVVKYLYLLPKVRKHLKSVDVVHAHYGFCGWLGRLQLSKPLVVSFMGSDINGDSGMGGKPRFPSRLEAFTNRSILARSANHIIVKSQAMADLLSTKNLSIIPNGVDIEKFQPQDVAAARTQLGWPQGRKIVLFPSTPQRINKGFSLAQEIVQATSQRLGEPIDLKPMWGIQPDQVPLFINASNAMLLTSFAEGSPNVVKEAMACNVPIVATDVGDVAFLLSDTSGNRVCVRQTSTMTNALVDALASGVKSNGRTRIIQLGLTLDEVARRILRIYEELCSPALRRETP